MHLFTRWVGRAGMLGLFLALVSPAWAQYNTATQDGTITSTEYNNNVFIPRPTGGGSGGNWFITWDANRLYLAKNGGNENEAAVVYLDTDPVQPVTDVSGTNGGNLRGNLNGVTDYGTTPQLPFRADVRIYFQGNYAEVRVRTNGGSWSGATSVNNSTGIISYYVNTANGNNQEREFAVNWSAITPDAAGNPTGGNIPSTFNWFAAQLNGSGGRYDQAPDNNSSSLGTNGGSTPFFENYFTVVSTANGYYSSAANNSPTKVVSFTAQRNISYTSFNSLTTWDFTMDSPGQSLTRTASGTDTDWNIGGTLTVSNGTLTFASGSASGATTLGNLLVTGNAAAMAYGTLDMNATTNVLNVTGATTSAGNNVTLNNGGRLLLGASGSPMSGGLNLNGNFLLQGATTVFTPNGQAVSFLGSSLQTITGLASSPLAFYALNVNGSDASNSLVQLASNISVSNLLGFNRGNMTTINGANTYTVDLLTTGSLSNETVVSNLTGFSTATRTLGAGGTGASDFGGMGLTLTPTGSSDALGTTTVTRSRGVGYLRGQGSSQSINRNFRIVPANNSGNFTVNLRIDYLDTPAYSEIPSSTIEGNLQLFRSTNAATYPTSGSGTFTKQNLTNLDQNSNFAVYNNETDFGAGVATGIVYTLGDQTNPLPVQLVSFAGTRVAAGAQLVWATALELHNAGFQVERQQAGGRWTALTFVPGQGSGQGKSYQYLDASAPAGLVYYRLRQVDTDGSAAYSAVVAVNGSALLGKPTLALSPAPAPADQANLTVDLSTLPAADRTLAVYDIQGRQLLRVAAPAGAASVALPVQSLAAGTYLVQTQGGGDAFHTRFIKL